MKKIFFLIISLVFYNNVFAGLSQSNWRWRKDDGSETSATWLANANTQVIITSYDSIRLRMQVNAGSYGPHNLSDTLEYSTSDNYTWKYINLTDTSNDFVLEGNSRFVTDGEATTSQLDLGGTFVPGKMIVSSSVLNATLGNNKYTEYEWCIKPTRNMKPNTAYYFKMSQIRSSGAYPNLLTGTTLPIDLLSFNVISENKRVKILWTTASEQNNSRFDIERSEDGKTMWQVIATVNGNGTTTQTHTYTAYDNAPPDGKNFYRIKQYDIDGKWKESEIRVLLIQNLKGLLTVFPNPARRNINFTLHNYNGKIAATLADLSGKIIHEEIISTNTNIRSYKLNLKNVLTPGFYVLRVKGEGLATTCKVIIQ